MSTRGCVAIKTGTGWRGVYNHCDSYPSGLGKELWDHLKGKDLKKFAEELLRFDDWWNYLAEGVCPYCGRRGLSQPHSISVEILNRLGKKHYFGPFNKRFRTKREMREYYRKLPLWRGRDEEIEREIEKEWEIRRNIRNTGFPDPRIKYHKHKFVDLSELQITSENVDPLFIEWVYVVDPEQRTMDILACQGFSVGGTAKNVPERTGDGFVDHGNYKYRHVRVARVSLDGKEPDWNFIEGIIQVEVALEDVMDEKQLIFEQLKGGKIKRSSCLICNEPALTMHSDPVHLSCLRKVLEELGGDAETWLQPLKQDDPELWVEE
ncbi:MAG: hypothetical protein H5T49_04030 [Hadesarchaea archaeon]|nr:hypothetical protein [Hadesarchaea archaeon]